MYAFGPINQSNCGSWTLPPPMEKAKGFGNKAIEKKSFIPKSLSVVDMMKLGKLIQNKETSSVKSLIEKFNMKNSEWSISKDMIFETEDKDFAEAGFRMAYKAKIDDESYTEEIHGLLRNVVRLRRKRLKRWDKPVNHNHKRLFK